MNASVAVICSRVPGFGASCFPKDARALAKMGEHQEAPMRIIETVMASNEARKRSMARKVAASCNGALRGKTIAILGLTFKADTDDMRDAVLAQALTDAGSILKPTIPSQMGEQETCCRRAFNTAVRPMRRRKEPMAS
jgi:UDPglucose 6-dehydrogenase